MSTFHRKLRQILMKGGAVSETAFDQAVAQAEQDQRSVTEILVKQGAAKSKDLLGLIAREIGLTPVDLGHVTPDPDSKEWFPEELAKKHGVCPLSKIGNCITVAMSDPFDVVKVDQLRLETKSDVRPVVALEESVKEAIQRCYGPGTSEMAELLEGMHDEDVEVKAAESDSAHDITSENEAAPAVKLVNAVVYQAIREKASDIHIEPFEKEVRVRFRQDGMLKEVLSPPKQMATAIVSRIKIMAGMDIAERRKPQDGKFQVKVEGRQIDFRVSVLPVVHGEKVVLRILDQSNLALQLDALGFEPKCLEDYRKAIRSPYGMVLITGPTGSGKSTTLYSALGEIHSPHVNIVTVEDPVEYQIHGVNQVPVNPKREMTFAAALRSILRQDPNVILIGEIRDKETIEIATKAALTGHLVLSTLHTNDAASTITRMIDMGLDAFMVSSSVLLICAQRLCRKLCEQCKQPVQVPAERLISMGATADEAKVATLFGPHLEGCGRCAKGYKGRFAVLETMLFTEPIKRLIVQSRPLQEITEAAIGEGMVTLRRAALLNAMRGKTSLEEVVRITLGGH
ncbi:MAG: Flp pilus assembly complex ATPase component TadA [Planctomycetes bacterium]|nr:Flp pilus assembly complex ATPase component TadA [Planctomycetota bacterium]